MSKYKITIYPVTPWVIEVEAPNQDKAKEIALNSEGPAEYAYLEDEAWKHEIMEWPNIGNGEVTVEKL